MAYDASVPPRQRRCRATSRRHGRNGRWAKKRHMPRFFGHKQGVDALVRTVHACAERGIEYLTVFAFSSENWKRPSEEVSGLMGLVLVAVSKYLAKLAGDGVRVRIVGDRAQVSDKLRQAWQHAEDSTRHNTKIHLSVAFNYGGRWDIVQACRQAMVAGVPPGTSRGDAAQLQALSYGPTRSIPPDRRRGPDQQLPALAGGLFGARLHRVPLARVRQRRARLGARPVRAARTTVRRCPRRGRARRERKLGQALPC